MIAFYNGVTGMMAHQEQMNVVSHNIANVNTTGFKGARSSFADLIYTQMNTKVDGENLVGHGVKHQNADLLYNQSGVNPTDYPLDFAIDGDAFFAVDNGGTIEYTRNGAFKLSPVGKTTYLVTNDGAFVLDASGKKITLPLKTGTNTPDAEGLSEKIGLYTFTNPYGLKSMEGSRFLPTDISGKAQAIRQNTKTTDAPAVLQGFLEFSGVDLGSEMVHMIAAQRGFQFNSRVVQTADTLDETINNLR